MTTSWRHLRLSRAAVLEMRRESRHEPLAAIAVVPARTAQRQQSWAHDWMEMRWTAPLIAGAAHAAAGQMLPRLREMATRRGTFVAGFEETPRCACPLLLKVALSSTRKKDEDKIRLKKAGTTCWQHIPMDAHLPFTLVFISLSIACIARLRTEHTNNNSLEASSWLLRLLWRFSRQNNKTQTSIMEFVAWICKFWTTKSFYCFTITPNENLSSILRYD